MTTEIYILQIRSIDSGREEDWLDYSQPETDINKLRVLQDTFNRGTLSYTTRILKFVLSGEVR